MFARFWKANKLWADILCFVVNADRCCSERQRFLHDTFSLVFLSTALSTDGIFSVLFERA